MISLAHGLIIFLGNRRRDLLRGLWLCLTLGQVLGCLHLGLFRFHLSFGIILWCPGLELLSALIGGNQLGLRGQQMRHPTFGSGELWELLQLRCPFLCESDGLLLLLFIDDGEPRGLAIADQLLTIFWLNCGKDREKVISITFAAFWIRVREELGHMRQLEALIIQRGNRDLIIPRR